MKHCLPKNQIINEFAESGFFIVTKYDAATGKRLSTYGGLNLHKAFAEVALALGRGQKALVFKAPAGRLANGDMDDYGKALQSDHVVRDMPQGFGER